MRCQAADQAERAVEMRRLGGRDWPQRSFVRVVMGFGLRDILIVGWRWRHVAVVEGGGRKRGEPRNEELGMALLSLLLAQLTQLINCRCAVAVKYVLQKIS
ncbi:hypothetical protein Pfo_017638, partial [Paulownia fortunei]